ncbi:rhodanese-like domain-containing protein [Ferrimonas senticii]|uniref:rhodanese-like domain-containing protein n=1 Tax=Ferrimonas senticii TaxID=394566 RepID=UPI0004123013|nr:rhodanese-like domain-containing protein [Ferrimonas senticii]
MRHLFLAATLSIAAVTALISPTDAHASARAQQAWSQINNGAVLIDVRSPSEFQQGHLNQALNLPHHSIQYSIKQLELPSTQAIVVYCRSGQRSGIAHQILSRMGYSNVVNGGGYQEMLAVQ